jgi:CheY-like chemotaxis protein
MSPAPLAPRVPIVEGQPSYVIKTSRPRHVLVIEDSLDSVHMLVVLLRDMGHVVDYAINGYAGLEIAQRMRPEFVLLDIGLPGLDGYDVCRRIKANPELQETKVVVITAYAGDAYRERSEAAGCHLHLVKPVPISVLEAVLA